MQIRPPNPVEVLHIEQTRSAYREMWASLRNVSPCAFDGTHNDIRALDFIDYEAGYHPHDLSGAALIWGNVLVTTGALTWAIGDDQHYLLTSPFDYPRALIFPYARILELNNTSCPQYGKYQWLLEEAVLRLCYQGFDDDIELKLQSLIHVEYDGFIEASHRWIQSTYPDLNRPKK